MRCFREDLKQVADGGRVENTQVANQRSTRHQHADSGQVASLHPLSEPLETAGGPLSFSRLVDEGCTKAICMQHPESMTKYACTVRNIAAMFTVRSIIILQGFMQELSIIPKNKVQSKKHRKACCEPWISRPLSEGPPKNQGFLAWVAFYRLSESKWCPWFSTSWVLTELPEAHSFWYFTIDCLLKIIYRDLKDMCLKYLASGFGHRCVFHKNGFASAATASWNPEPGLRIASVDVSCRQTRLLKASGSP